MAGTSSAGPGDRECPVDSGDSSGRWGAKHRNTALPTPLKGKKARPKQGPPSSLPSQS